MITARQNHQDTYQQLRQITETICEPLTTEDYVIQSIEDVSPPKWHLAHTTWFFETFLLQPALPNYKVFNPHFHYLFNSYYQSLGKPFPRNQRGVLSRPTVENVYAYRKYVNQHLQALLSQYDEKLNENFAKIFTLGLHHEQQHQELLLMDIKHNLSMHPDFPAYKKAHPTMLTGDTQLAFSDMENSLVEIGYAENAFCFDNELPRHRYFLEPYSIANRLITNAEYCEFIAAKGYERPEFWLAEGWDLIKKNNWFAPLYWQNIANEWYIFTLSGLEKLQANEPVVHVSYYEADAFARWRGMRLPTEFEWENFACRAKNEGNFLESGRLHPQALNSQQKTMQLYGDVWEWTSSPYCPYPGYQPAHGALGEYNGKFMSNQIVLRGGCCVTPKSHIRASYRNFYQPDKRWQFSGIRLAADKKGEYHDNHTQSCKCSG